jgi:hypothetical protein
MVSDKECPTLVCGSLFIYQYNRSDRFQRTAKRTCQWRCCRQTGRLQPYLNAAELCLGTSTSRPLAPVLHTEELSCPAAKDGFLSPSLSIVVLHNRPSYTATKGIPEYYFQQTLFFFFRLRKIYPYKTTFFSLSVLLKSSSLYAQGISVTALRHAESQ